MPKPLHSASLISAALPSALQGSGIRRGTRSAKTTIYYGLIAAVLMFTGCRHGETVLEYYPDGSRKASYSFLIADDSAKLRHGVQMTWYQDGSPESMELYRFGYREGNVLRWYPGGALKSKEHYAAGVRDPQTRYWNPRGDAFACGKPDEWDPGSGFWPHGPLGTDLCSRN